MVTFLLLRVYAQHVGDLEGHLVQLYAFGGGVGHAALQFADGEYVVDEAREALGLQHDDLEELFRHGGIVDRPVQQRFHKALDGGERRFELVGDVGHEVRAHLLETAQLGDVLDHGQRADHLAVLPHGRYIEAERAVAAAHGGARGDLIGIDAALAAHGLAKHALQVDVFAGFGDGHALGIGGDARQLPGHGRDQEDVHPRIHDDDAALHLVHDDGDGMVAAALAEHALLDLLDDGVDAVHFLAQVATAQQPHAGVIAAVREVREYIRYLTDDGAAAHVVDIDHGKHQRAHAQDDQGIDQQAFPEYRERRNARTGNAQACAVRKRAKRAKRPVRIARIADDPFLLRACKQVCLLRGQMLPAGAIVIQRGAVGVEIGKGHLRIVRQRLEDRHALRVAAGAFKEPRCDRAAKGKALGQFPVAVDRERISAYRQDHQHERKRKKGRFDSDPGAHRRFSCLSLNL